MNKYLFFTLFIAVFSLFIFPLVSQEKTLEEIPVTENIVKDEFGDLVKTDDVSILAIDRLLWRTEYDEALRLLNIYIEKNPEKFDLAQSRIKRIMNIKMAYAELADRLIKLIETDPGNDKEIYEITARLESFEKHPSDERLRFIADLKKSAEFNYFRAFFNQVITEAAQLTEKGQYVDATEKIKSGFWLYRDDFYDEWGEYPKIIAGVEKLISQIDEHNASYLNDDFRKKMYSAVSDFNKTVETGNYEESVKKLKTAKTYIEQYSKIVNDMYSTGIELEKYYDRQMKGKKSEVTESFYLTFISRYITGISSVDNSGYLGTYTYELRSLVEQMKKSVEKQRDLNCETYYVSLAETLFENDNQEQSKKENDNSKKQNKSSSSDRKFYSTNVKNFASLGREVNDLYGQIKISEKKYNPFPDYTSSQLYAAGIFSGFDNIWSFYEKYQQVSENLSSEGMTDIFTSIKNINSNYDSIEKLKIENTSWGRENSSGFEKYTDRYESYVTQLQNYSSDTLKNLWSHLEEVCVSDGSNLTGDTQIAVESGEKYLHGVTVKLSSDQNSSFTKNPSEALNFIVSYEESEADASGITYKYPGISLSIFKNQEKQINNAVSKLNESQVLLNKNRSLNSKYEVDYGNEVITRLNDFYTSKKLQLSDLSASVKKYSAEAQKNVNSARLAKEEGDSRFSDAERALKQEKFETARKRLQEAVDKYNASLSAMEDESLRITCDTKILDLSERIVRSENEVVVKEVRQLKNQAKDAYFNGRFDDAESLLNQAKTRWAVTHVEEDDEINSILSYVNTAVSMQTGREILPSAPLYPEMSQLLSLAFQYYNSGKSKIEKGNKSEGFEDLDMALDNLQQLQYVYPLNKDASILTLQINKLKDPSKFKSEFSQKIEAARNMCKNAATRQEGYTNLLDYYQIDPGYNGLKNLIYQIEIDIGIRQKPVDNSASKQSAALVTEAQKLLNSAKGDEDILKTALDKVNQAIALNPNNNSAMILKDKIATASGGTTTSVLSMEDEEIYQQALQKLQNNDVISANILANQLLKNKKNSKNKKLLDLKNKIDARL